MITDGVKIAVVDTANGYNKWTISLDLKNSTPYNYEAAAENDLINFILCHHDKGKDVSIILATWNTGLRVYEITSGSTKGTLTMEFLPPGSSQFTDAVPDHGRYWALA